MTADVDGAKERIRQEFSIYPGLPSYKAMLDREGAADAADIAFVGDEETVAAAITEAGRSRCHRFRGLGGGEQGRAEPRRSQLLSELARS